MNRSPWTFVFAVMITGFLVVAQIYAVLPLLSAIETELGITDSQSSFIPTAFGFAYAFGFFIFGPIADKMDRMVLLVAGLVALAGASALAAMAGSYLDLVLARVLQGLAAASFPATALALVSQKVQRKDQPFAISMLGFAFLSSAPLSQLFVGTLGVSFATVMWWVGGLYLLCALVIGLSGGTAPARVPTTAENLAPTEEARRRPPVAAFVIAPATVLLSLVSFHALVRLEAGSDPGIDPQFLRLVGFPPLLLCFLAPSLTKRFGPGLTASFGLVIAALGMGLATVGIGLDLASVVVSAGVALAVPGLIAAVTFWSGDQVRARALATYTFFLFAGASVAPVVSHALFRFDTALGFGLPALAALGAAVLLVLTRPGGSVRRVTPVAQGVPVSR